MKPVRSVTGRTHEHKDSHKDSHKDGHEHRHHKDDKKDKKVKKEEHKHEHHKEKFIDNLLGFNATKPQPAKPTTQPQAPTQQSAPNSTTGIKRALLIGINYLKNSSNGLNGCINDVKSIRDLLTTTFGYRSENIVLMSDDQSGSMEPTKQNILDQINKTVALVKSGDTLFIHYSGHGTQVDSTDDDEKNNPDTPGEDDCLCPCNFADYDGEDGFISDDVLKEILVNQIPVGAKLRAFFDCCHSGSALDLEYLWKNNENFIKVSAPERQSNDILLISGCRDSQTSADSWNSQKRLAMGALTMAMIKALNNTPLIKTTWKDLVLLVRHSLATDKYTQFPMLSVSDPTVADVHVDL